MPQPMKFKINRRSALKHIYPCVPADPVHCKKGRVIKRLVAVLQADCPNIARPGRISRIQYSFVIAYLDCHIHLLLHACARQRAKLKQYSMTCGSVWIMNLYRSPISPHIVLCIEYSTPSPDFIV